MFTEKTFNTSVVSINYAEGPAYGTPLVMLHGATLRWQSFLPVLPSLSFRYHTYALDLRGHGRSGHMTGAYRVADYAADVVQLLRERVAEPAILLGHSLGADVAIQVAAEAPTLTYAVVLDEPGLYVISEGRLPAHPIYHRLKTLHDLLGMERSMEDIISAVGALLPAADNVSVRAWAKSLSQLDPDALTHIIENRTHEHYRPNELLPKIACPALLLQGNPALEGLVEDPDAERALALLAQGTHVRLQEVGHGLHGAQPTTFFQLVSSFLESL